MVDLADFHAPPVLSVMIITYNHASFIAQALDGVLSQKLNFTLEIVIGEDCSIDGTREIVIDYQKRYPQLVRVLLPEINIGAMPNLIATMAACRGEFIAILEGDDYWTDPTKLQRQVNALRANPNCSMCFHDAQIVYETSPAKAPVVFSQHIAPHALPPPNITGSPLQFTQLDLARVGWIMPTASIVFRNSSLPHPLPSWFLGIFSGDYTLQLLSTRNGAAFYLPIVMSCYRVHQHSVTVMMAQSEYQYKRRIYEGEMYQQHVFTKENKKHADIYLSNQILGYARYLGKQGYRWRQLLFMVKYGFYFRQRLLLYAERRVRKLFE